MITIHRPEISVVGKRARLSARIDEDGLVKTLWYEVDRAYADGLNPRSDAFVVALLYWAMVYHHDITCEAPLTERLHFQLQEELCPVLAAHSTRLRAPRILAPLEHAPLPTKGAVGTGCSGGIDSFHVIVNHLNSPWPSLKLTHLATFSVGHVYEHTDSLETLKIVSAAEERARYVAEELGLGCVNVRSNYNEEFPQTLIYMAPYADMACVHALGALFGSYFYASQGDCRFGVGHRECKSHADYDVFSLPNFSTPSLTLYSEGPGTMRWSKVRQVAELPVARRLLNVCCQELRNCGSGDGHANRNCGRCDKCQRTLLDLDALGLLNCFSDVFDLDEYRIHGRRLALRYLLKRHLGGDDFVRFAWSKLRGDIRFSDWWVNRKAVLRAFRSWSRRKLGIMRVPRFKDPRIGTGK